MDRDGILRLCQRIEELDLLLAGVSGYVRILEDHVSALLCQLVHHFGYRLLFTRDRVRTEDDHISRFDRNLSMCGSGHPAQCRHGLSLASRRDEYQLFIDIVAHLLDPDQSIVRNLYISKLRGGGDRVDHTPTFHDYFLSILVSAVDDLLHTVHIGRKGGDDDPVVAVLIKKMIERSSDSSLGWRVAFSLYIGTLTHESQNALLAELRNSSQINGVAEYRRGIALKIYRVDDNA